MAIYNHERVGKAMDLVKAGVGPFAERKAGSAQSVSCMKPGESIHGNVSHR